MIVVFAQEQPPAPAEAAPPSAIVTDAQDSAPAIPAPQGATTEAPRVGPPDTSYYMKLGYAAAFVIFVAYIGLLLKRVASVRRSR